MEQNPANLQNSQQPITQTIKKKVRQSKALKPQHFQKKNGLQALYKSIQKLDLTKGEVNIQATMKKIVIILKTWHFQMIPKYSLQYFLQRCRALGNNKFLQNYMTKVRRIHKGQDQWQTIQPQQTDALNINLDHLNPDFENNNQKFLNNQQTTQQKIQRAMKLINQIQQRTDKKSQYQQMQIEQTNIKSKNQDNIQQDQSEDQCQELFRQMQTLQKQKKSILSSKSKKIQQIQINKQLIKDQNQNQEQQEQMPYIPDGYQSVSYEPDSEMN